MPQCSHKQFNSELFAIEIGNVIFHLQSQYYFLIPLIQKLAKYIRDNEISLAKIHIKYHPYLLKLLPCYISQFLQS